MQNKNNKSYYTLDKIPTYRIELIDKRVKDFIKTFSLKKWPLDFVDLVLKIKIDKSLPLEIMSMPGLSNRIDATTVFSKEHNMFIILVNRNRLFYPFKSSRDRRLNFTLAHELAHIFLNHYDISNELKNEDELELEELEADEFAGRILMPEKMIIEVNFPSLSRVAKHFNVSESAVLKRLTNLDKHNIKYKNLKPVCENCGNEDILGNDDFCIICGDYIKYNSMGVSKMKYEDGFLENEETNRLYNCPICGNRDIDGEDNYCIICGHSVTNECTECSKYAESHARYCRHCGKETLFNMYGILDDWKIAKDALTDKMEYELSLAKGISDVKELDTWNTYVWNLYHENIEPLYTLLEGSSAKLCGDTVVIYVLNDKYKEILESTQLNDELYKLIPSYLEVKASAIKIKTLNEFYAPIKKEAIDSEIPF